MEQKVKTILRKNLNDIYNICLTGFDEAKKDRFWEVSDRRYKSTRIYTVTTYLLEEFFKNLGIATSRLNNTFRFQYGMVVGRFKKLNNKTRLPQNFETYHNNQFISKQTSLFENSYAIINSMPEVIPITIGYFTDPFFSKIESVEILCQAFDFRFELIGKASVVTNINNNLSEPVRDVMITASQGAKQERLINGKLQNHANN